MIILWPLLRQTCEDILATHERFKPGRGQDKEIRALRRQFDRDVRRLLCLTESRANQMFCAVLWQDCVRMVELDIRCFVPLSHDELEVLGLLGGVAISSKKTRNPYE